ncbi:hypothetical protein N7453_008409 [Penicillium expansum]|nr:hypothetical protein N7453_008409 [Penicillium expansum]
MILFCSQKKASTGIALVGFTQSVSGDNFHDGQYTVYHKLGFGESATVWLAVDNTTWRDGAKWVALKILAAHIKEPREIRNLQYLRDKSAGLPKRHSIVTMLDTFLIEGPNGTHHCLVLEFVGPSFESIEQSYIDFNNYGNYLEFENTKFKKSARYFEMGYFSTNILIHRLLNAVQYMHSLGLCHGGISGANIAFKYTDMPRFANSKELFEILGSPQMVSLERCDGMLLGKGLPKELIQSAKWTRFIDDPFESIRLIGFGKSFIRGEEPGNLKQPVHLRCPEAIMGEKLDYRLDLWHTGCFIYQLATLKPLFPSSLDNYEYIKNMVGVVEDLPIEWEPKLEELRLISEQTRRLKDIAANNERLAQFLPIIDGLLRFRPSDRLTLHEGPMHTSSVVLEWVIDFPLAHHAPDSEQELPISDEQPRLGITGIQEVPEQPQPEVPEGALDLSENHEQQLLAQDETTNLPDGHGHQSEELPHLPPSLQQESVASAGTSEPLVSHELQQPQVSEVCQSTEKAQLEAKAETLDLVSDHHENHPASPGISENLGQEQLEVVGGAPGVLNNQGEQQPEVSEVPESSKQSELETTENVATSSGDSHQQDPGIRKRLRSRLGELLNHGLRPWKRRRNT